VAPFVDGLLAGKSTAGPITRFDTSGYPARIACEVPDFEPAEHLPKKIIRQLDPFTQYAMVAAEEALRQAQLLEPAADSLSGADPTRVATLIASSAGGVQELTEQHTRLLNAGPGRVRPFFTIAMPLNMASARVAIRHGLRGASFAIVSACASAGDAIGVGLDLIRAGRADIVLAGGAEATINPLIMAAFGMAGALSTRNDEPERASRPFDRDRDGFVKGEGAGVLVLERATHAAARGVEPLAELAGYASTNDAYHPNAPRPDAEGAVRAIQVALADAGATPAEVSHINAHGTSTPANDRIEATAIRTAYGSDADRIAVTSTKSAIGHLVGAAGAVEAIATIEAMRASLVPPTLNLDHLDPDCPLDVVTGTPRRLDIPLACSHSFGFGGHNAVLVFRAA
jgi:beta-ketoacyl-acyl-carrier-protein synthase II